MCTKFQHLLFGNTALPFAFRPMPTHALEFPEAASTVEDSMYIDDVLDSCETVESVQHLHHQLSSL